MSFSFGTTSAFGNPENTANNSSTSSSARHPPHSSTFSFGSSSSSQPSTHLNPAASAFSPSSAFGAGFSSQRSGSGQQETTVTSSHRNAGSAVNSLIRDLAKAYGAKDESAWETNLVFGSVVDFETEGGHGGLEHQGLNGKSKGKQRVDENAVKRREALIREFQIPNLRIPSTPEITAIFSHTSTASRTTGSSSTPSFLISYTSLYINYLAIALSPRSSAESLPKRADREWRALDAAYAELNRFWLGDRDSGWIGRGLTKIGEALMDAAFRSATLNRDKRFTAPSVSVDRVRKTFQAAAISDCRASRSDPGARRGDVTFALGNLCWRVYDRLKAYRLLDTISQTYYTVRPSIQARLDAPFTSKAEVVAYWYWSGKLKLGKGEIRAARDDLANAFNLCPVEANRNLRAIFIRYLTCQILLGQFPVRRLLDHFQLHEQFSPLIEALRSGDRALYYATFHKWSDWYRRRGIWLVLREKGEVIIWRSLFRNAYRIWYETQADGALTTGRSMRCPTHIFVDAAKLAFRQSGEDDVEQEDTICLLASLIDQSYIRGQLSYTNQYLVMPLDVNDKFAGFPPIAQVRPRQVIAIA